MSFSNMRWAKRLLMFGCAIFAAGALMAPSCPQKSIFFSHKLHVKDQDLDCEICHEGADGGAKMGAPSVDTCLACHDKNSTQEQLAKKAAANWPRLKGLAPDGKFSHKRHLDADVKCVDCHGKIADSKKVTQAFLPQMETCVKCHEGRGASVKCSTCHKSIAPGNPPPNHGQAWLRFHGDESRDPVKGARCFLCHQKSKCKTCHQTQKPESHTYAWRNFGHGTEATISRSKCATCHRTDFCIRCHKKTPPASHRAGWGRPGYRHCLECHVGGGNEVSCSVCHGARITHSMAPVRPTTVRTGIKHRSATNCRACHSPLAHPDNGDNCKNCHY